MFDLRTLTLSSISLKPGKGKPLGLGIFIPPTTSPQIQNAIPCNNEDVPPGRSSAENGYVTTEVKNSDAPEDEDIPSTAKIDKGKGRAEPEPERPAPVLRRPSLILDDEDEEDDPSILEAEPMTSPTNNRSRSWVEEEGEVFRKGTVLLGPEEMEGEYAGEDLRKELLEANVERPPPRPWQEDDIYDFPNADLSPTSPSIPESPKPSPRSYIRRTRSPTLGVGSPTISIGQALDDGNRTPTTPNSPSLLPEAPLLSIRQGDAR